MNRIHRTVWSKARNALTTASEAITSQCLEHSTLTQAAQLAVSTPTEWLDTESSQRAGS